MSFTSPSSRREILFANPPGRYVEIGLPVDFDFQVADRSALRIDRNSEAVKSFFGQLLRNPEWRWRVRVELVATLHDVGYIEERLAQRRDNGRRLIIYGVA